ncbi:MAG: adenylyltransferase/cytidyltransferase family protein [Candidatus Taylorbacteria bacterium]|nr:adenylyltransferase/cytidyltransferase family protein [Candidatus Taylorbacteria bacterium]
MNTRKDGETRTIGVTFSAFDLCHAGHMRMLKDAKSRCDYLIVGLQDDPAQESDEGYRLRTGGKSKNRPIMSLDERMEIIKGIRYVDEVFVYSTEDDLYDWLKSNRYDVRILGSDWEGKPYTGHDLPHMPYFHRRDHGYSTSELRERIYRAEKERLEALQAKAGEEAPKERRGSAGPFVAKAA